MGADGWISKMYLPTLLLERGVKFALYVDVDTRFQVSLQCLWMRSLLLRKAHPEWMLAMVPEPHKPDDLYDSVIRYHPDFPEWEYYNSGVILMDTVRIAEEEFHKKLLPEAVKDFSASLMYSGANAWGDQWLWNAVAVRFPEKYYRLGDRWNVNCNDRRWRLKPFAYIVHFCDNVEPF